MRTTKNPLTIYEKMSLSPDISALSTEQILYIMQKTPRNHVYKRPAKGGGEWEYVSGAYVEKVLNYVFAWNWDFEIKSKEEKYGQVIIAGRLTIRTATGKTIVKEQIGRADIQFKKNTQIPLDYGNTEKAASTDCLKKCASKLGIASDIYSRNEFKQIEFEEKLDLPTSEKPVVDDGKPVIDQQKEIIKKLITYDKLEDADKAMADEWINDLTFSQASTKIVELAKNRKVQNGTNNA